ncbi:2-amino-4-hydroxy-6-hydroxymethyldihydropteridine diphosphokinase [Alishewanella jeotgali]|uniref:2-amino-4-hydroxy-6-hydroxymethyldihydropteridine pyrophosphokinase n=1 Tax=Alishewanella jeotgali KCTC 22429 TaxID=1129374 RepID=H3ZGV9_9ALTE|nr:2-amino-4-hydroxy-6-hydroxymethyldihydropteridine diphosphokinase [Alishewanella jeotgali]EHR40099.1 2-amino-4-hydroxy-6-hydroxymethyldihydropteridine pyrophosphokinase [Alishewanella jeotgali KCTC 22429]
MLAAERCYIGLGANLVKPVAQLQAAVTALGQLPETRLVQVSRLYSSKPMGPQDQPDYVNAVAALDTRLTPLALLHALQQIELAHGRQRKAERWGPRTLDLDILLFGMQQIDHPELTVPHYGMQLREFVLYPLAELAPDLILPDGVTLQSLLQRVPLNGLTPLQPPCD